MICIEIRGLNDDQAAYDVHCVGKGRLGPVLVIAQPVCGRALRRQELIHSWHEFTGAGYTVTIASPTGGHVEVDSLSNPLDPSRWSVDD